MWGHGTMDLRDRPRCSCYARRAGHERTGDSHKAPSDVQRWTRRSLSFILFRTGFHTFLGYALVLRRGFLNRCRFRGRRRAASITRVILKLL